MYRDVITPARVAGLLILYGDWPRSLAASIAEVQHLIGRVMNGRSSETSRLASQLCQELADGRIQDIMDSGLHAYLVDFLARVNDLASRISRDFLVPLAPDEGRAVEGHQPDRKTRAEHARNAQADGSDEPPVRHEPPRRNASQ